jgi:Na+-driven multidrug efflux pump
VESLAAMALVFPTVILTMTMSGGAMGGGVASAIARAIGAGDIDRASTLAAHALLIGLCFGLVFMLGMLIFGPALLELLGGRGNVLTQAVAYTQIFFGGAIIPWLMNTMAGILRGTGNMKLPSLMMLSSAVCQIILGGTLGLGLGPIPQFGMRGVAAGSLIAYIISISVMSWYLFSGRARVIPKIRGLRIAWAMFIDILKVGAIACFSPLQSVLTISIFTHMLASFGTEILAGYGIGARLEFMLTSIAFAVGIASVPMVGMAIGAQRIARARRICWIAGASHSSRSARSQPSSLYSPTSGSTCSPTMRACAPQAGSICRRRRRCMLSSALPRRVFFIARRGQGDRPGAGADRAAVVHRHRRLVAVDAAAPPRRISSCWLRPPWCCSACCRVSA